ncbi:hypothetical protein AB1Y20_009459 [Prymnesium parvum]|uniref:TNase-like domain-containing protein n=1 Tax=Prymnesium parvum TaxID=97485 RepID=A0AB34K283_PRYPA
MGCCCSGCCVDPEDRLLQECTEENTKMFVPDVARGKVVSVYDGDTLTVAARHARHGTPYLFRVRLAGVDAPEIRGSDAAGKAAALAARDALREQVLGKMVSIIPMGRPEKYGRLLARVELKGRDMSKWLLEQKLAVPYDGSTKQNSSRASKV